MKRIIVIAVVAAVLLTIAAVTALAAPGGPGWGSGMMGQGGYGGMMGQGGYGGMMGQGGYGGMMGQGAFGSTMHADLEELLGLSIAEIHEARLAGKSLVEIAAGKGVGEEALIQALLDGRQTALDAAVEDGRLTRDAADQMLDAMKANIETMVNAEGMGPGMMGGFRGAGPRAAGPCHGGSGAAQPDSGVRGSYRGAGRLQRG